MTSAALQSTKAPSVPAKTGTTNVTIMLYSDDASVRREVRLAVGESIGPAETPIEWSEVATATMAMQLADAQPFDLLIGDNETAKLGGVGLVRQLRNEITTRQPMVLLLLARQQDAWLAAWSGADAAMETPVDPFALRHLVAQLLGLEQA